MDDDIRLLEAVRHLDQEALVSVFDRFAPLLYKYAMRLCGDPTEADDIVGEVFEELLKHLSKGQGPRENLRAYLYQIAYHKVVDHARHNRQVAYLDEGILSDGTPLSAQNEQSDEWSNLEAIIRKKLSQDQRHVIVLRFFEDLSLKETAAVIGKTENNIKIIQKRAITRIRKYLDREE